MNLNYYLGVVVNTIQSQMQLVEPKVEKVYILLKNYRTLVNFSSFFVGHKIDFYKLWKTINIPHFMLFK